MTVFTQPRTQERTASGQSSMIGFKTALVMVVAFIALIAVPPVHQLYFELNQTGHWRFLGLFQEVPTPASLKRFEESLASDSQLAGAARQLYRTAQMRLLGQGNDKIVVGRDGFLFFRQEVEMAAGPGFLDRHRGATRGTDDHSARGNSSDSIGAIVDFERQLRARAIHLVFVPIPVKPFIYPEEVWAAYPTSAGPAWNRDREAFRTRLTNAGVDVLDVTDALWHAKTELGQKLFLKLDTHWTPRGLAIVADRLATHVQPHLAGLASQNYTARREEVTNFGDMLRILEITPDSGLFTPETVAIFKVLDGTVPARGDDTAQVLLLGDSFTNIYHRKELEWGEGAGLGEQLMYRMRTGVQVIAINGGGATAARESLSQKLGALRHKKVVVWACSARDLYDDAISWDRVALPDQ